MQALSTSCLISIASALVAAAAGLVLPSNAIAQHQAGPAGTVQSSNDVVAAEVVAKVVYLGKAYPEPPPLSLLDKILTDEGVQGARVALKENNMTGRLIQHKHDLIEAIVPEQGDFIEKARELLGAGHRLILADLERSDLIKLADLPEAQDAIIFNVRSSEDELRAEDCRSNLFHIPPSYAMRADAIGQYLLWKKWRNWILIVGTHPGDKKYATAIKRAAGRFGGRILEERTYTFEPGSRRTESGHQQVQTQMPQLTQSLPTHDVLFVADVGEAFGEYLLFRTAEPRPVVGTHGLQAVAWHRSFEQYAGMQMQNRFEKLTGRVMTERDYFGWLGTRVFGEAVTRTGRSDAASVRAYILSKDFEVAGFKGQGLTFRTWDQQMRQPVLLSGPRSLVSMSPQDGFLHPKRTSDTLGYDEPETKCRLKK